MDLETYSWYICECTATDWSVRLANKIDAIEATLQHRFTGLSFDLQGNLASSKSTQSGISGGGAKFGLFGDQRSFLGHKRIHNKLLGDVVCSICTVALRPARKGLHLYLGSGTLAAYVE